MLHESQLPRSCDRCHSLKERCQRVSGSQSCERCGRLRLECQTKRPFKRPGRRPRSCNLGDLRHHTEPLAAPKSSVNGKVSSPVDVDTLVKLGTSLTRDELQLVYRMVTDRPSVERFVLGPSFYNAHRTTLSSPFLAFPELLHEAYVACCLTLPNPVGDASGPVDGPRLRRGYKLASSALATLRSLEVRDVSELSSCLALGGLMLTFVGRLGGEDTLAVSSQALALVKPFYDSGHSGLAQIDLAFVSCLVASETAECLLRTRLPTLRFRPTAGQKTPAADRYIGLCGTLMPYLHDLCCINYRMLHGNVRDLADDLANLERTIQHWQPVVPEGFSKDFTPEEITNMICQTHVMRAAALLILHRIRHPFGSEQEVALVLARTILLQLDTARLVATRRIRCIDFALMAACFEIPDAAERAMHLHNNSSTAVYSSLFLERSEAMLTAVWDARKRRSPFYWYHLGSIATSRNSAGDWVT